MALRFYDVGYLTAIADAVRADLGLDGALTLPQMAEKIPQMVAIPAELKLSREAAQEYGATFATGEGKLIQESHITALADAVRARYGITGNMTLPEMAGHMNSFRTGWLQRDDVPFYNKNGIDLGIAASTEYSLSFDCCASNGMSCPISALALSDSNYRICAGFYPTSNKVLLCWTNVKTDNGRGKVLDAATQINLKKPFSVNISPVEDGVSCKLSLSQVGMEGYIESISGHQSPEWGTYKLFYYTPNFNMRAGAIRNIRIIGGGALLHHFVPVKVHGDSTPYLFDVATGGVIAVDDSTIHFVDSV